MNKKLILALSIFTASFTVNIDSAKAQDDMQSMAQKGRTPEQRAMNQVQRLTKALTLSTDQVNQIKPLLLELNQKRDAMREATDRRTAMKEMRDLVMAQNEKMKTILSAEQYTKYEEIKDNAKDKMKGRRNRTE